MTRVVVAINGRPRSGKDSFCTLARGRIVSSVDRVKRAAFVLGWPLDRKLPHDRKFLSDLKDLSAAYNDGPVRYLTHQIEVFENGLYKSLHEEGSDDDLELMFLMIREPRDMDKVKDFCASRPCKFCTLRIVRPAAESVDNNPGDRGADEEYSYDFEVANDGTLDDLQLAADEFRKQVALHFGESNPTDIV
jgi:hypothetical protein